MSKLLLHFLRRLTGGFTTLGFSCSTSCKDNSLLSRSPAMIYNNYLLQITSAYTFNKLPKQKFITSPGEKIFMPRVAKYVRKTVASKNTDCKNLSLKNPPDLFPRDTTRILFGNNSPLCFRKDIVATC